MKKIPFLLILMLFASCSDLLEEEARSLITRDEFLQTEQDGQALVDAIYSEINDGQSIYAQYYWLINGLMSDLGEYRGHDPDLREFADFQLTSGNRIVQDLWSGLYRAVAISNYAIDQVPLSPTDPGSISRLLAEAHFFRGMLYFDLVRFFGEVPLELQPVTDALQAPLAKVSIDSIYVQIESDLTFAFENLPANNGAGRPDRLAAAGLLAKIYLTAGEFVKAGSASRLVLASDGQSLLDTYAEVFLVNQPDLREFLFSISLNAQNGGDMNLLTLPKELQGWDQVRPSSSFVENFAANDLRGPVNLLTEYIDVDGQTQTISPRMRKYWDPAAEPFARVTGNDIPYLRYADILLLHAEIINELRNGTNSESLGAINLIRTRAGLPALRGMNKSTFLTSILEERQRELGWEGHRWFDLVRTKQLENVMLETRGISLSEKHHLLPIPARELMLNPGLAPQNPGY